MDTFTTITHDTLAGVTGGMNVDDLPLSDNIEDRRGEPDTSTFWERFRRRMGWERQPKITYPPPNPEDANNPMAIDLGIRDLDKLIEKLRKR